LSLAFAAAKVNSAAQSYYNNLADGSKGLDIGDRILLIPHPGGDDGTMT